MEKGYPRPQLRRNDWIKLDGLWKFVFDDRKEGEKKKWFEVFPQEARTIMVPYTYETRLSGIGEEGFHETVWYQRNIEITDRKQTWLLHFEGVDYRAKVWVNGFFAGEHCGGYARFSLDISSFLKEGENNLVVRADDSMDCVQPRGKQRWKEKNFGCWYVQTTGIWKTVWLEAVPQNYIEELKITPDLDRSCVALELKLNKKPVKNGKIDCRVFLEDQEITVHSVKVTARYVSFELPLADPEEPWKVAVWSPEHPRLYDLKLMYSNEKEMDEVTSYFGMRKISIEGDKILLNNRPLYQRLILDQGYWEESYLTPPSEEALIRDIELVQEAGFNGVRKHEKIEDERFLYWCDRKGLLVWCEMPSQYIFNDDAVEQYTSQWMEIVRQNYNHPSIVTWTAFNESWGIEQIYTDKKQQMFTESIYSLTKTFDPMRPVIVNDGWEHTVSDIVTLHDYEESGNDFSRRYCQKERILDGEIPFNKQRYAMAKGYSYKGQPILISEYGGIAFCNGNGWGYGNQVTDEEAFLKRYRSITDSIKRLPYAVGFCYTQVTDVQQEINGLYTEQRTPKVSIEKIREINLS